MTALTFEKMTIPSANFGGVSSLPILGLKLSGRDFVKFNFPENEGLYMNYGKVYCAFPYRAQDMYDRALNEKEYETAVLENDNLRAVFFPSLGGKLWSLIDKKTGRELLFKNNVVRPCNLAVRNAWTSGGVEWNMGFLGHSPMTCSPINTARTALADGTPVLRFYWFERVRACIAQMDIFLPEKSEVLYVRTRLTNPNNDTVPMYWWSNIATVQERGSRVIVPATEAYVSKKGIYCKEEIPMYNGVDVTYPLNSSTAHDYFWKTQDDKLKYICQLDADGYGLATTSTDILRGRKLFVWGDTQGGRRWQNFLTRDGESGSYNEIQVGLARTQLESLPMPPRTVWEWVETYGAMQADKEKVHGDWADARAEVEAIFAEKITKEKLNKILEETQEMAKKCAETVTLHDGWARLEEMRREKTTEGDLMCPHLDFAETQEEQSVWLKLLNEGTVGSHTPDAVPVSYQIQSEWLELLENAIEDKDRNNWYAYYLLGTAEAAKKNCKKAKTYLEKSLELTDSTWANYALATVFEQEGDLESYEKYMLKAYEMRNYDISLAKEVFRCVHNAGKPEKNIELFECAAENVKANTRCLIYYAYALARCGRIDEAEKIIADERNCIVIPDIKEGETITTEIWDYMNERRAESGLEMLEIPHELNFRMSYNIAK